MNNKALKVVFLSILIMFSTILLTGDDHNQYSNISDVVDDFILGNHANYYDSKTGRHGDPEGILSTIGAVLTTLSGLLFGKVINDIKNTAAFSYGAICVVVGLCLCCFLSMPVIKKLWTPPLFFNMYRHFNMDLFGSQKH